FLPRNPHLYSDPETDASCIREIPMTIFPELFRSLMIDCNFEYHVRIRRPVRKESHPRWGRVGEGSRSNSVRCVRALDSTGIETNVCHSELRMKEVISLSD